MAENEQDEQNEINLDGEQNELNLDGEQNELNLDGEQNELDDAELEDDLDEADRQALEDEHECPECGSENTILRPSGYFQCQEKECNFLDRSCDEE